MAWARTGKNANSNKVTKHELTDGNVDRRVLLKDGHDGEVGAHAESVLLVG